MAAISSIVMMFEKGDHFVVGDDVYGGTYRVLTNVFNRFGVEVTYVNTRDLEAVRGAVRENTKALFLETPSNPLLKISDIPEISKVCKEKEILLIVDNTFMTPYWQNPLQLGADMVMHSATKYLGGHSDVVAGLVVVNDAELVRMQEHESNTQQIVQFLKTRNDILSVFYPGLEDHPDHDVQKKQARGFGGMVSFDVGSAERADQVLSRVKYFTLAESLGAVESLISVPARMTHASIPQERRAELGITEGLVRISVGLEDIRDLIEDLEQALSLR